MKLRTKTIITISLISLLMFGALQAITALVIDPSFKNIETNEGKHNIDQALDMINYSLTSLQGQLKDYSFWDDTYNFVQNKNQDYVDNNFVDLTFQNLNLNLIAIVDNNSNLIYCQTFDLDNAVKIPPTEELKTILTSDPNISTFHALMDSNAGLIYMNNQPMMIASAPILTSLNKGPMMGWMVFGRYLDKTEITQLTEIMGLNFSVTHVSDVGQTEKPILDALTSNQQEIVVKEESPTIASAYTMFNDIDSNPSFILQVTHDMTVNQQGTWVKNIFLVFSLVLALCVGVGFLFLLNREIIGPMRKLAHSVDEISFDPNAAENKGVMQSSEEFNVLSNAVRNSMNKRLEGMNEVSRMVAHDLRNPLAGIRGATYILKKNYKEKLDEKGSGMLKVIDNCVDYSEKIVKDLLDFSGEIKLNKTKTSPAKLVDSALTASSTPANIQAVNEVTDRTPIPVDNIRIERVFVNLITNAYDAMPNGGQLKVTSQKLKGYLQIDFADTGQGMSKETLQKLWSPFFTTKPKGLGIGLGICKRLVEAHKGKITVESTQAKGTVFSVFLPLE